MVTLQGGETLATTRRVPQWVVGFAEPYGYARAEAKRVASGFFVSNNRYIAPANVLEVSYMLPEETVGDVW